MLLNICFCVVLPAQDKIDRLSEKIDRIADQQVITNAKLEKLTEQVIESNKQQPTPDLKLNLKA